MKNYYFKMAVMVTLFLCATTTSAQGILKIGDEFDSDIKVTQTYQRFTRTNANKARKELVYQKEFYSKESSYIKLYFKNFDLAPGDYVEITGMNSKETIVYGGRGKIVDDQMTMISDFWSKILFDDKVVLKLYSSGEAERHNGFEIGKVAYGYSEEKIMTTMASQTRSICSSDNKERIACYQGTTMFEKAKAVCRLIIGGSSLCTGWLLGEEGHLMTNNHCIGSSGSAQNTDYVFNYQYASCSGSALATRDVVASSATFIKTDYSLDYTLVKLPTNPTNTYGYLSLSSVAPVSGDRIYIPQHPGGRRKEISVKTDIDGTVNGYSRVYESKTGYGQQVKYYADTEGGSSGSPVIDYNSNLVISIHNTGGCPNGSYGRCDNLIAHIGSDMPSKGVDNSGGGGNNPKCDSTVSYFPYRQSFENTLGDWKQSTYDNFNWATRSGSTPSRNTGPSSANAGSYYLYVESSAPNYPSKSAIVTSPCFDLSQTTSASFTFDYHMYGTSAMGNLKLEISTDKGATWSTAWQKSGNQGNSWLSDTVNLSSYAGSNIKLRFNGTTGSTWQGDMAIDNLALTTGTTGVGSSITLTINLDNYPEETSWIINDNNGNRMTSGGTYGSNSDGSTVTITTTLPSGCYTLVFNDSYGDGICCSYGSGSYSLKNNDTGALLASGGQFGSSETSNFCVGEKESFVEKFVPTQVIDDLMIYPNPVPAVLSLKIPERELTGTYKIVNVTGAVIKTGKLSSNISVNEMQDGVYILEVTTDQSSYSKTFVKVKEK